MKRLAKKNLNTAEEYNKIFRQRLEKGVDWFDLRRWKELVKYFEDGNIVDLGCLDSGISELLWDRATYVGVDLAKDAIDYMEEKCGWKKAKFIVADVYDTGLKAERFDYAVMGELLEHLETPQLAVKEAFRLLKPGGILAISCPLEEEKEPGAVDGDHHLYSFSKIDLENLVKPYASKVKFKVIGSQWLPYRYAWPSVICWATKNG